MTFPEKKQGPILKLLIQFLKTLDKDQNIFILFFLNISFNDKFNYTCINRFI